MRITESHLRQVIRQIIKEQFHNHNFSKSDMQLIGKVGAGFFIANFAIAAISGMITIYNMVTESGNANNCKITENGETHTLNNISPDDFEEFAQGFEGKEVEVFIKGNSLVLKSESGEILQLTLNTQDSNYRIKLAETLASAITGKHTTVKKALAYGSPLDSKQTRLIQTVAGISRAKASGFKF